LKLRIFIAKEIIESALFIIIINVLIICNTTTLAMNRYPISEEETNSLETANFVFSIFFACEMLLKIAGMVLCKLIK
jgi:hypothetical protein